MNDNNILLPTGDYLRQLIGQNEVKSAEIKKILRHRGVFTSNNKKDVVGPILIKTGISPSEFNELKESYKTKEESPKSKTRAISWKDNDTTLLDSIPDDFEYTNLLNDQFGVCQLSNPPIFAVQNGNPDHIAMDFEISRKDLTKNWGENITHHKGRVEFKKNNSGLDITLSLSHTARETKEFGNKIAKETISHFKSRGYIDQDEQIKSIKFSDFSNKNRVQFMNELTQKIAGTSLQFIDTKDIHFSPDNLAETPPENLSWMKDKIEDLKMKGKGLHSTFFVHEKKYHEFIQILGLVCKYNFSCTGYSGSCDIRFEFSEKDDVENSSELTLIITVIKLDINDVGISKPKAKKELLDSIEETKMLLYDKYRIVEDT